MIVSRTAELARLDDLLSALRRGRGSAFIVHGEAGIGKTTLLDALVERSTGAVVVLRACGAETEVELAFSALADLLAPVLGELDALPPLQAAALTGALALGPPVPGDRLAVCVATLGLLRAAAARRPVLVVLDDVQWVDASSRECVEYVARRAGGGLAVVLAARDPWYASATVRFPELALDPLDDDGAAELLRQWAPGLAPPVAAAITEAAAGNPLALVELPATLTTEQRSGVAALELPLAPAGRLHHAYAGRVETLAPSARQALLIAALHADGDLRVIATACRRAGTDVSRLAEAEASGLVRLSAEHVTFVHPLVRGTAYQDASAAERRAAHTALAAALRDDRRAWHLAAAAIGPDEGVATRLERLGGKASARRAYTSASVAFERAAQLTSHPEARSRRLLAAGHASSAAGTPDRALALLEEAADAAVSGDQRALAEHARGRLLVWRGRPAEAIRLLVEQARLAAPRDPALAAAMLADAANGATTTNQYLDAEKFARRAAALVRESDDPNARAPVLTVLGWVLTLRGRGAEARPVLEEAARLAEGLDELGSHWPWLHLLLRARIPHGEFERAQSECAALAAHAREAGALAMLTGAQMIAADVALRLGDWDSADELTLETIRLTGETAQPLMEGWVLITRARLTAARGRDEESRAAALAALEIAESRGVTTGLRFVHTALGFLHLCLDRVDDAVAELEAAERLVEGTGHAEPTIAPWAPDLVEAYVRQGRLDEASLVLATLRRQAASTGSAVAAAAAARCRGLLENDFDAAFAQALELHDRRPMPFERARTLLAYGRRLHRARRRAEARERLRQALQGFEGLRAAAWTRQTEAELRSAGARRRRGSQNGDLTPQELRVAMAVRRGRTNRQIAAELFLSPKTVEFHLRQIYSKLDVHSRAQLVAALAERQPPLNVQ
jgi:DNA-binding CsgD family transcriptional regulator